jgi:hypothetical protein
MMSTFIGLMSMTMALYCISLFCTAEILKEVKALRSVWQKPGTVGGKQNVSLPSQSVLSSNHFLTVNEQPVFLSMNTSF